MAFRMRSLFGIFEKRIPGGCHTLTQLCPPFKLISKPPDTKKKSYLVNEYQWIGPR